MSNFLTGLDIQIPVKNTAGVSSYNPENDKLISEAVILDTLGGDKNLLLEFYNELGAFGNRDGILNESAGFDLKLNSATQRSNARVASLLVEGAEAGSVNYDLARKALLLFEAAIDALEDEKGKEATKREEECKKKCSGNVRIAEAVDKVKSKCK